MWAMIPMLRTLARAASAEATVIPTSSRRCVAGCSGGEERRNGVRASQPPSGAGLPAVVREGLVRLGHLVGVLTTLHRGTEAVARVEELVHQPLDHGLLAAGPGVRDQPAQPEGGRALGADLDRYLVGRATDAAALHLEGRLHVVHGPLQGDDRVGTGLLLAALERAVDDRLGQRPLATEQDLVHHLGDQRRVVDRVRHERAAGRGSFAWHYFFSLFAPYRLRACLRLRTPWVSSEPRMILYRTPGRSFTRPPRTSTIECSCRL